MKSYIAHIRNEISNTRQAILTMLGWSEEQLFDFQHSMGKAYLQALIPRCPDVIDALVQNRIYWNWWRNEWLRRDRDFLKDLQATEQPHPGVIAELYRTLHSPEFLAGSISPHAAILEESYATMIGNFNDSIVKA